MNVAEVSCLPDELRPETAEKSVSADSNRLDAIVCRVFNLSRETAQTLIADQLVKINGEIIAKSMRPLQQGDVVSVRGHGKFRFVGESGQSRKGKTYFMVEVFC